MSELPDLYVRNSKGEPIKNLQSDLSRFLVVGGADAMATEFQKKGGVKGGNFGGVEWERLDILVEIKEHLETNIVAGKSQETAYSHIINLKQFFSFIDSAKSICSLETLEERYLDFAEHLLMRVLSNREGSPKKPSAYGTVSNLARLFEAVLELPPHRRLLKRTRWRLPKKAKKAVGKASEKQSLEDTFAMGSFMMSLINCLDPQSILGELPLVVPIKVRDKEVHDLYLPRILRHADLERKMKPVTRQRLLQIREPVERIEGTVRPPLVNLRIAAELCVFIAQTGMNKSQATELDRRGLKYKPMGDTWRVRAYKGRRTGEVSYDIHKDYKPFQKNYIDFLQRFTPDSDLLFPKLDRFTGEVSDKPFFDFGSLKNLLKECGIPWTSPSMLRKTRINWLLRRSGDEELTAGVAQHAVATLKQNYELPSQQRSMIEITRFWNDNDPIKSEDLEDSLIASQCDADPEPIAEKPAAVVDPDCLTPSGCLWCKHLRDVDSFEYVWSLVSFRYLKSFESGRLTGKDKAPSDLAIDRITEKTNWFRDSSEKRANWVVEAEARVEEGDFHPNWAPIIEFLEGS